MEEKTNLLTNENLSQFVKKQEKYKTLSESLLEKRKIVDVEILKLNEAFNFENKKLLEIISILGESIESDKELFKEGALISYEENKEKKQLGGLGIRVTKKVEYEESVAFEWAKKHQLCLKLDDKAFKNMAKLQKIEGVTVKDVAGATFPKKIKLE